MIMQISYEIVCMMTELNFWMNCLCLPLNKQLVVAKIGLLQMCSLQSILADMVAAISVRTLQITH